MNYSKRIIRLKLHLIKDLPFFPNNKATQQELEGQSLNSILIHYLHWKTRFIPPRPRKFHISPEVTNDKRWRGLKIPINELLKKISDGRDVTQHLSKRVHKHGYTPRDKTTPEKNVDAWDDKDRILNTKGFHHLHLGENVRSNEVLFARVTRSDFYAIGIFDHSVFEGDEESGEKNRMWKIHKEYCEIDMEPGASYLSNPITSSGHPVHIIKMADYYAHTIINNDRLLDVRSSVNDLYNSVKMTPPAKFDFDWVVNDLDIGALDRKTRTYFIFHQGFM